MEQPIRPNHILLVQREKAIDDHLVRNLRSLGYEVRLVFNGEEAVGLAAGSLRFDLVLIDVDLSLGMDGPQAASEIISRRPVPIIFLIDQPEQQLIEKVKEILHYGYLPRIADKILLKSAIEMALQLFATHARSGQYEQRMRAIFDQSSIGIEIYDSNGQIIDTNPACLELFGVSKLEDILGFRLFEDPNLSDEMK